MNRSGCSRWAVVRSRSRVPCPALRGRAANLSITPVVCGSSVARRAIDSSRRYGLPRMAVTGPGVLPGHGQADGIRRSHPSADGSGSSGATTVICSRMCGGHETATTGSRWWHGPHGPRRRSRYRLPFVTRCGPSRERPGVRSTRNSGSRLTASSGPARLRELRGVRGCLLVFSRSKTSCGCWVVCFRTASGATITGVRGTGTRGDRPQQHHGRGARETEPSCIADRCGYLGARARRKMAKAATQAMSGASPAGDAATGAAV